MQLGHVDRRRTRYVRRAIDQGLEQKEALKRNQPPTEAVDPELDQVVKRLMRRVRL